MSGIPQPVVLASAGRSFRIEFHWQQDRFEQRLFFNDLQIGHSIEGDSDEPWPTSPPLQQLSLEQIDNEMVVLGVGSAGRAHWSISVEVDSGEQFALKFDVACRSHQMPKFLGSRYELPANIELASLNDSLAVERIENDGKITTTCAAPPELGTTQWSYRLIATP